jgi:hypothetical protein
LADKGVQSSWLLGTVIPAYQQVLARHSSLGFTEMLVLSDEEQAIMGHTFNRAIHVPHPPPLLSEQVLNPNLDFGKIQVRRGQSRPSGWLSGGVVYG